MQKLEDLKISDEDDPRHPANKVAVHNLMLDDKLESQKEYNDLLTNKELGLYLNKQMKCVKAWRKPEDPANSGKMYMNTYRNGFVSAIALSYNFHLPLVISPNDIWLTVMQGFKLHLHVNKDKEFIKIAFRNMKKLDSSTQKYFKMESEKFKKIEDVPDDVY